MGFIWGLFGLSITPEEVVEFQTITFIINKDSTPVATAWAVITHAGTVSHGGTSTLPVGATISHRAYLDASTYSPKYTTTVTAAISIITYNYDTTTTTWSKTES